MKPWRKATLVAAVVALACTVNFFVLRPLLEQGSLDRSAVLVNVAVTVVALPGLVAGRTLYIGTDHHLSEAFLRRYYAVVSAVTTLFYFGAALLWIRWRRRRRRSEPTGRRAFLGQAAGWTAAGGLGLLGGYSLLVEPRWPALRRVRLPLADLPESLVGLTVVQLSDLHLGRFNSSAYLQSVVQRCNALRPDLVLLTGDYVHGSPRYVPRVAALLGALRPRLGTLGVLGNHDHWEGAELSRRELRRAGVRLVDNRRLWVTRRGLSRGGSAEALCVAGVGDYWEDRHDLDAALDGVDPRTPRLLLSHNPDFAESRTARSSHHRVDLMLAGHTHGGQVRLPGGGSLISPSRYGSKYDRGLVQGPRFKVFVSAGVGTTILPVRLLVRPEIVLFRLTKAG